MGHVYLLKVDCTLKSKRWLVKMGMTDKDDVQSRYKQIHSQWKNKRQVQIDLHHCVELERSIDLEGYLHGLFKEFRVPREQLTKMFGHELSGDTEFFVLPPALVQRAINQMDAYQLEKNWLAKSVDYSSLNLSPGISFIDRLMFGMLLVVGIACLINWINPAPKPKKAAMVDSSLPTVLAQGQDGSVAQFSHGIE
jgi:Meiotically up-regulated gene 113